MGVTVTCLLFVLISSRPEMTHPQSLAIGLFLYKHLARLVECRGKAQLAPAYKTVILGQRDGTRLALASITFYISLVRVFRQASCSKLGGDKRPLGRCSASLPRCALHKIPRLHSTLDDSLAASGFWAQRC